MQYSMEYRRAPSALVYQLRAFLPSPGMNGAASLPPISAAWRGYSVSASRLHELFDLAGLRQDQDYDVFFPHVFGFRLQMAILTHRAFPVPIWKVLQVRNSFLRRRALPRGENLDLETRVARHRVLEKGLEIDLHTTMSARGDVVWEGLTTFYYRGQFKKTQAAEPAARAPEVGGEPVAQWETGIGGGGRFAKLSGDYNGIHSWDWYARRLGFPRALFHPQRILGHCLARLPRPVAGEIQRMDVWIKGPVFYGSSVALYEGREDNGLTFALRTDADPRPAIVGRWVSPPADPDHGLNGEADVG